MFVSFFYIFALKYWLIVFSRLHAGLAELGRRGMQNKDNCFRKAIEDSLKSAEQTVRYLQHEPFELSEGQICAQTRANIESLRLILASTATSDI